MQVPPTARRIAIVTTTRAEWHLLEPVVNELATRQGLETFVLAGGTHLEKAFGMTVRAVEASSLCPIHQVSFMPDESIAPSDHTAMTRVIGQAVISFADAYERHKPDVVLILGDRFEILSAALAAVSMRIPLAHLEGGHVTEGAIDERYRNAISKLADIHFPALPLQGERLRSIGVAESQIVATGPIGAALARRAKPLAPVDMETLTGFNPEHRAILIATVHSETASTTTADQIAGITRRVVETVLDLNLSHKGFKPAFLFTLANLDPGGDVINKELYALMTRFPEDVHVLPSIGRLYIQALMASAGVIGNSSSGILEACAIGVPVLNIGNRQKGRDRYGPVTDVPWDVARIVPEMQKLLTDFNSRQTGSLNQKHSQGGRGSAHSGAPDPWVIIADHVSSLDLATPYSD
ncbi:UDP-N-acetylglucosamine 2-epimerase [Mesorhizobium sp. VK4C]|uniref:UDP-N-acetylglucosamine 2-epimerase n=1 Tax=Mesorhizobium captivum TaxID=3072319 RepID=UPI002A24D83C|nr:UDP-N-acetylglucosamine 2-epimerase [Mesorhizobium sp. VK4C]MDX8498956.1 UDP-N-acetylglucosamine 2-epimerase [Mesorhizobium sp. VK4C]